MYFEETKKVMVASIAAALLNVVLNALLIPVYGYIAAAFTTLICYIFLAVFHYFMAKKVLKQHGMPMELFDGKTILVISFSLLFFLIAFEYLYTKTILRYIAVGTVLILMIIKRTYFYNLLKTIKKK